MGAEGRSGESNPVPATADPFWDSGRATDSFVTPASRRRRPPAFNDPLADLGETLREAGKK